ncbi:hypothetical protein OC845_000382 [Tilletia horrida]|nr:hypothetical protein OC845_000382 [Tilletia horrida]
MRRLLTSALSPLFLCAFVFSTALLSAADSLQPAPANFQHHLIRRDAYNGKNQDGGISYGPLPVPSGSRFRNLTVGSNGEEMVTYWSKNLQDKDVRKAIIMFHGRQRDGGNYFTIANDALKSAIKDGVAGATPNTLVIAPQFLSKDRNPGQYSSRQIAFADVNQWQVGARATYPRNTPVDSFSAISDLLSFLADKSRFPNLNSVVLVGHGGGGQLMSRYAAMGSVPSTSRIHFRFVVGDPSTNLYFTPNRPLTSSFNAKGYNKDSCPLFNTYRYGYDKMAQYGPSVAASVSPKQHFRNFVSRDVVLLVGMEDTDPSGDQSCMALLTGGTARRDRNLMYWRYLNQLAGTNANLSKLPGKFSSKLPDWSQGTEFNARLVTVPNATHDPEVVFSSSAGRSVLFK